MNIDPITKNDIIARWLSHREKLVQTHVLSRLKRARSYDYFQASQTTAPKFFTPAEETLEQLERPRVRPCFINVKLVLNRLALPRTRELPWTHLVTMLRVRIPVEPSVHRRSRLR